MCCDKYKCSEINKITNIIFYSFINEFKVFTLIVLFIFCLLKIPSSFASLEPNYNLTFKVINQSEKFQSNLWNWDEMNWCYYVRNMGSIRKKQIGK